jgi:hypothetical protein
MDYLTMEVDIDHGKVSPRGSTPLPNKATGLLTIFPAPATTAPLLQTLESLQKHLGLDAAKAKNWMDTVQAARR